VSAQQIYGIFLFLFLLIVIVCFYVLHSLRNNKTIKLATVIGGSIEGAKSAIAPRWLAKFITIHNFWASNHTKINIGLGFAPDLTGGAFNAPPDLLADEEGQPPVSPSPRSQPPSGLAVFLALSQSLWIRPWPQSTVQRTLDIPYCIVS